MKLQQKIKLFFDSLLLISILLQPLVMLPYQYRQVEKFPTDTIEEHSLPEKDVPCISITQEDLKGLNLKELFNIIIEYSYQNNLLDEIPLAFINCYKILNTDNTMLPINDLNQSLSFIIEKICNPTIQEQLSRAPRPDAPGFMDGSIVGPLVCDFSEILEILRNLQNIINQCCQNQVECCNIIINDLNGVFTVLNNLTVTVTVDFTDVFTTLSEINTTLTTCCAQTQNNFNGTFTVLNDIETTFTSCCANITNEFNGVFTVLNNLTITATVDFSGVFTVLNDIETTLTTCCAQTQYNFNGTFTVLNDINNTLTACCANIANDFNGVFTVLSNLKVTATVDLSGVFTVLNDIDSTLTTCCANLTNDFNGVFTLLNTDFGGTFTVLNSILSSVTSINNEAAGTFTVLNSINNTLTACCANIANEFNGTFTVLETGFNSTFTLINSEFNGTFTVLNSINNSLTTCCANLTNDFNGVFTLLNTDFGGTFTVLNSILSSVTSINSESAGTFTVLNSINNTLTACCANITNEFNGTFTALNSIVNKNCSNIPITQADVDAAGGSYIISTSGNYFLQENIVSTGVAYSSIIQIMANDVTLDLCQRQLGGLPGNLSSGIFIDTATHVTIKNGIIQNMFIAGIVVNGGSNDIELDTITTLSCDFYGFQLGDNGFVASQATNTDPIVNSRITHCAALYCSQLMYTPPTLLFRELTRFTLSNLGGLFAFNCFNLVIKNSLFNQNLNNDVFGVGLFNCSNCILFNCTMNGNLANQFSSGLSLIGSNDNYIENCTFNGNLGNNITRYTVGLGAGVVLNSSSNNVFINCQASNNAGDSAIGFASMDGANNVFKECVSTNNTTNVESAYGFSLENETASEILECQTSGNIGITESAGYICTTGTANVLEYCVAVDNQATSSAAGFILRAETGSSIKYCTSNNNIANDPTNGFSYGILLDDNLQTPPNCINCYLQNNSLANNLGPFVSFGIQDVATNASTSLVGANFAFNNGTNFDVTYVSALLPVVSGSFSTVLPATGTTGSFDNIDINP